MNGNLKVQEASDGVKGKIQDVSDEAMEKIADLKKKYKEVGEKEYEFRDVY